MTSKCGNCSNWNNLMCGLTNKVALPNEFCVWHNWKPYDANDVPDEVEIGVDLSLNEIDDLDGDNDEVWTATVPYIGR